MIRKRITKLAVTLVMMMAMLLSSGVTAMAASPTVEEVEHKGKGRVEVDFYGNVRAPGVMHATRVSLSYSF